jgi:hypothetical protein
MRLTAAIPTWTPIAVADTIAMTTLGFHNIQGGVSTQRSELREVYIGGQAGASSPTFFLVGRVSTVGGATLTATRLAPHDPSSVLIANPPVPYQTTSGAFPQRSATLGALLNLSMNAFGGIVRWQNGPDEIISILGVAQPTGEISLNAFTGGTPGLVGSHFIIETV